MSRPMGLALAAAWSLCGSFRGPPLKCGGQGGGVRAGAGWSCCARFKGCLADAGAIFVVDLLLAWLPVGDH